MSHLKIFLIAILFPTLVLALATNSIPIENLAWYAQIATSTNTFELTPDRLGKYFEKVVLLKEFESNEQAKFFLGRNHAAGVEWATVSFLRDQQGVFRIDEVGISLALKTSDGKDSYKALCQELVKTKAISSCRTKKKLDFVSWGVKRGASLDEWRGVLTQGDYPVPGNEDKKMRVTRLSLSVWSTDSEEGD